MHLPRQICHWRIYSPSLDLIAKSNLITYALSSPVKPREGGIKRRNRSTRGESNLIGVGRREISGTMGGGHRLALGEDQQFGKND